MTLAHVSVWKIASWMIGIIVAVIGAMDASWKILIVGALIASIAPTITGIFSLVLQTRAATKLDKIGEQTDGMNKALQARADTKQDQLIAANKRADHADGVQQERVEARERHEK
jgi:hypothetical protein